MSAWREMTAYERAILARLLDADLPAEALSPGAEWGSVVQIDRCGCLGFVPMTRAPETGSVLLVQGRGPQDDDGTPIEVVLTMRDGRPIWLEFRRNGGANDFWPEPEALEVVWREVAI